MSNSKKFNYEEYNYFEEYDLPKLILGIKIDPKYPYLEEYKFKDSNKWIKIGHQTAGHACHQHYFIATIVTPKSEVVNKIKDICDEYLDSDIGCFGVSLNEIINYSKLLKNNLDVDCLMSYKYFEEAIYPIDYSEENLKKLTDDVFPDDLNELIEWDSDRKFHKFIGCIGRWGIYILGGNCD